VHTVIVDEWHELIGNKRGVQVQLALARLRRWNPAWWCGACRPRWAIRRGDAATLVGAAREAPLVQGRIDKALLIDTLLPADPGRFSWGGHLGAQMQQPVVDEIERSGTTLVFTNTRSQAEIWYQLLLAGAARLGRPGGAAPRLAGQGRARMGRSRPEGRAPEGRGGHLQPGPGRGLPAGGAGAADRQRQGRGAAAAARRPQRPCAGPPSRVTLVPTTRWSWWRPPPRAAPRWPAAWSRASPPEKPLDVLVQHLVTVALGGGFEPTRCTPKCAAHRLAYRELTRDEFDWALAFVERGGDSLAAYPEYHRVQLWTACGACPTAASRGATGCRWAPSSATPACR
jgi:ATP-dependent Lhr-like helicase